MEVPMLLSLVEDVTELAVLTAFLGTIYAWSSIFI
jgi:hypothetical protein